MSASLRKIIAGDRGKSQRISCDRKNAFAGKYERMVHCFDTDIRFMTFCDLLFFIDKKLANI